MTGLVFLISESRTAFFVHESVLELCQTTSARRKQSNPGGGERGENKKKITFLPLLGLAAAALLVPGGQLEIIGGVPLALAGLPVRQERVGGGDGEVLHARTLPELEPDVVVIWFLVGDDVHAEQPEDHRRRLRPPRLPKLGIRSGSKKTKKKKLVRLTIGSPNREPPN